MRNTLSSARRIARCRLLRASLTTIPEQQLQPAPDCCKIEKILVANRGEIACRVIRTARSLGLRTVSVFSDADAKALHVRSSDEAVCIGPSQAQLSYLNANAILDAARRTNADAIHPGYGFLSENSAFADSCARAGFKFIGPSATAISLMGNKSASKKLMAAANVPIVPGYHGDDQSFDRLLSEANSIGYPVLIKPVLGGGGKGMRIVHCEAEFAESLKSAIRESQGAFGDSRVLVEKYIAQPRHIEVQVFGDKFGNYVYLFERDCSVQRRHQKIIEEAPAPCLKETFRKAIGEAAVNAAKAVNYENAGTVEFIVDTKTGEFFFMEMNTRLQVEHPVTEMVTQQDLVEWQIRVANGERLPCQQDEIPLRGHAFEARIYAENVSRGFLPATGSLYHFRPPNPTCNVRIETGVVETDSVTMHYDPMIAKLVVLGSDRNLALTKLSSCLSEFQIGGVPTNIEFLKKLAKHPSFRKGEVETHFIEHFRNDLLPSEEKIPKEEVEMFASLAATGICLRDTCAGANALSPFPPGYRLNHQYTRKLSLEFLRGSDWETMPLEVAYCRTGEFLIKGNDFASIKVQIAAVENASVSVNVNGVHSSVSFGHYTQDSAHHIHVWKGDAHHHFRLPLYQVAAAASSGEQTEVASEPAARIPGSVTAPMSGLVVKLFAEKGAAVKEADPLLVLVAMKMEHVVRAPKSGVVSDLRVSSGQQVNDGDMLLIIKS